jgi:hypothetical protein
MTFDGPFRRNYAAMRIEIGNDGWIWPQGAPTTTTADLARRGLRGKALDRALRDQASRHLRLGSAVEQLPDPENRVTLDPGEADRYGVPLPRLAYRLDSYVEGGLAAARAAHAEIFRRLGATGSSIATAPKARDISSAPRAWEAIRKARWSIATSAATIIPISSSSALPCSRPRPRPIPR